MKLYDELAEWWPLFSAPADYAEEAEFFADLLTEACAPRTVLELGSGGGNNALYLKSRFKMTLVDLSPLQGLKLTSLDFSGTRVKLLSPRSLGWIRLK